MSATTNGIVANVNGNVYANVDPVTGGIKNATVGGVDFGAELCVAFLSAPITHTGTVAETKLFSALIPAGTILPASAIRLLTGLEFTTTATAGNRTTRIKLNTSDSLSGATTMCSNIMTVQSVTQGVVRTDEILFPLAAQQYGSCVGAGWNSAQGSGWSSGTYDVIASDLYLIVSVQLADAADSMRLMGFDARLAKG